MNKVLTLGITMLSALNLVACGSTSNDKSDSLSATSSSKVVKKVATAKKQPSSSEDKTSSSKVTSASHSEKKSSDSAKADNSAVLAKLVRYTDNKSAGPTRNYYWDNGKAKITGFDGMKAGGYHFSADDQGRSSVAKAVLTYSEYENSKGSRQGEPLDPPAWPSTNDKVAIQYSLTGQIYHGYLYNRSHSIADSLLGKGSYSSEYNFTTGTRPQNVGADQNGGMRYAEETAEDYWSDHPNTKNTISYETTPLYKGDESIPRGSVVDLKSSDDNLNKEIVVINSVEDTKINYNTGIVTSVSTATKNEQASQSKARSESAREKSTSIATAQANDKAESTARESVKAESKTYKKSSETQSDAVTSTTTAPTANAGGWTTAPTGKVFVSDSEKYYTRVKKPDNYELTTQASAEAEGAIRAIRGNQYAQP
ncbi:DNA/RNA non-specific endonuclease [Pediococcus claussenii]|uniref:Type VII secretion system protein EssD-like domain-containing protein n=1 Tax=Pediococcus claussenii (strain ATCC BAA-344 / DSM 14800 / JCM 18046 / KCTC 3811 / LMG 21948 / P06) TaxID=701521 RepID=G8PD12_PEDCP|nr:DNA/RNA non-specific endonuclease [Pediococcus claussenii]AEV95147.1 hypothetical protein PECL_875 [Pediococcus claussenii ATCC BAA-344]ANZ70330.1 deoxyribonuclease [Pediococcus claussenii]ANZ72146.1 deoxyribonuclease [Pediococcus claussenii]KRN19670.1 hypothetical protein IV79_GL001388 [Pediococcus claussenii]